MKIVTSNLCLEYIFAAACMCSAVLLVLSIGNTGVPKTLLHAYAQDGMAVGPHLLHLAGLQLGPEALEVHTGR